VSWSSSKRAGGLRQDAGGVVPGFDDLGLELVQALVHLVQSVG